MNYCYQAILKRTATDDETKSCLPNSVIIIAYIVPAKIAGVDA